MFINHSSKEVTAKIVYYGPGLSGKTSCIQYIFSVTNPSSRGELISIETEIERTLFFDLLPMNVGLVKGYQTKFQLYTVPGQIFYDSTRKLVLKGVDGIVFVADSQRMMEQQNLNSLDNLKKNLIIHNLDINDLPMVFQYNKRDLGNIYSEEELNRILNPKHCPYYNSVATKGDGVIEALRKISGLILNKISTLVDQAQKPESPIAPVEFDTNKKQEIISKEKLPLKKFQAERLHKIDQQLIPEELSLKPISENIDIKKDEELKVETGDNSKELSDIFIQENSIAPDPYIQFEEINDVEKHENQVKKEASQPLNRHESKKAVKTIKPTESAFDLIKKETNVNKDDLEEIEDVFSEAKRVENEELIPEDINEPFKDLGPISNDALDQSVLDDNDFAINFEDDIESLGEIDEFLGNESPSVNEKNIEALKEAEKTKEAKPFKIEEKPDSSPSKTPPKPLEEIKPIQKEIEPKEEAKIITNTPPSPGKLQQNKKETKKAPIMLKELELFNQLKDNSRLTLIKPISSIGKELGEQLFIDVKDKDSNILESFKIKVTPEIKKITIILDVKK